jgi:hypothetical protein
VLQHDEHVQAQRADPAAAGPVDCCHAGQHVEVVDGACRKSVMIVVGQCCRSPSHSIRH